MRTVGEGGSYNFLDLENITLIGFFLIRAKDNNSFITCFSEALLFSCNKSVVDKLGNT